MIELALPAGNLESALCAFRSGADAVYFGMKEFSARKGAVNFDEEDLSKISRYAKDNGRRIYVTVNTLVDDGEIEKAIRKVRLTNKKASADPENEALNHAAVNALDELRSMGDTGNTGL